MSDILVSSTAPTLLSSEHFATLFRGIAKIKWPSVTRYSSYTLDQCSVSWTGSTCCSVWILWDYDSVKTHSAQILIKLKGPGEPQLSVMPPAKTGGAWPSEWISLFDRWIQGGFRRL